MKILVLGATGATGRELVKQGLEKGYSVTAFVRNPAAMNTRSPNLEVVQGNVGNRAAVENAINGQHAVLCALGPRTLLRRDVAIVVGVHNILTTMEIARIRRFIYLSANTVHASREDQSPVLRVLLSVLLQNPTADHELNERMIQESHLDWTIVRPPRLTNGPSTGSYRVGEHLKSSSFIPQLSRADLAEFMLKQLTVDTFLYKATEVM
jgi:putative NADH-flavin reductase